MALEIERKYLVNGEGYRKIARSQIMISQGYLSRDPERTVRIRLFGDKGLITIKGKTIGDTRKEFEYEIPAQDAKELLDMCEAPVIEKIRYFVPFDNHVWEVDEYKGALQPLVTAEIELTSSDEDFDIPSFVGMDVTGNPAYYNSNLAKSHKTV